MERMGVIEYFQGGGYDDVSKLRIVGVRGWTRVMEMIGSSV